MADVAWWLFVAVLVVWNLILAVRLLIHDHPTVHAAVGQQRDSVQVLAEAVSNLALKDHSHPYAAEDHEHPHDHPHDHEHVMHTHTLKTVSRHEENGQPVFVKKCTRCATIVRDDED